MGDWTVDPAGMLHIKVTSTGDWRYDALLAIHELVEALLCRDKDISQDAVDQFDLNFSGKGEPGDEQTAPYYQQHQEAFVIEHTLSFFLTVNFLQYCDQIDVIFNRNW
jgi:hypothetical protein